MYCADCLQQVDGKRCNYPDLTSCLNYMSGSSIIEREMKLQGGTKHDAGKVPLDLLAPEFLWGTAKVLHFGADKYEAYNWAKGMKWSRVFGAMMRHMWAWWAGKGPTTKSFIWGDLDDETKMSHLWHASCCLMFLVAYEERGTGEDDRYTG